MTAHPHLAPHLTLAAVHSKATAADTADLEFLRLSSRQLLRALAGLRYVPRSPDSLGRDFQETLQELIHHRLADVADGISPWFWLTQALCRIEKGSADADDYARWADAGSRAMSGVLQSVEPDSLLPCLSIHVVANLVHSRIMSALAPITAFLAESPAYQGQHAGLHC